MEKELDSKAYRGEIFYFKDTATLKNLPQKKSESLSQNDEDRQYVYIKDGVLIVENGKVKQVDSYENLKSELEHIELTHYAGQLITPAFIDTHQHATQSAIVSAYGEKLLEWLNYYVFPSESAYRDPDFARKNLNFFLDELLKNGTTTAVSYGPLFYEAADIFFEELNKRNMRFITGNIIMDCDSPEYLQLSGQENYDNAKKLIAKWHNKNRLSFCVSPRFALSCSEEMLELCGALKKEYSDVYIQTHLDENQSEIKEVKRVFPWSKHYMDVYDHFGLVTDQTIFGHCVHLNDSELECFKASKAIISSCPLSNNFLGSGLFNFGKTIQYTDRITLGSDWGGGNSLSMFAVMDDAYKVAMLNNYKIPSMIRWYLCTLGAAKALQIDDKIGSFSIGKEADFIVINPDASSYLRFRTQTVQDIFELLFILMTLADDRNITATYIMGKPAYLNPTSNSRN